MLVLWLSSAALDMYGYIGALTCDTSNRRSLYGTIFLSGNRAVAMHGDTFGISLLPLFDYTVALRLGKDFAEATSVVFQIQTHIRSVIRNLHLHAPLA